MLESEELETTSCRSRSSSSEVHALQLFFRLVAISSGHAHFRALEAAGLSFRSALPADWQQHFLLSGCGLAWLLALRWFSPAVVCDVAFQSIH